SVRRANRPFWSNFFLGTFTAGSPRSVDTLVGLEFRRRCVCVVPSRGGGHKRSTWAGAFRTAAKHRGGQSTDLKIPSHSAKVNPFFHSGNLRGLPKLENRNMSLKRLWIAVHKRLLGAGLLHRTLS